MDFSFDATLALLSRCRVHLALSLADVSDDDASELLTEAVCEPAYDANGVPAVCALCGRDPSAVLITAAYLPRYACLGCFFGRQERMDDDLDTDPYTGAPDLGDDIPVDDWDALPF